MVPLFVRFFDGLLDHRIESRIEQHLDQAGGGVIAAGGLALVTGGAGQLEGARFAVESWDAARAGIRTRCPVLPVPGSYNPPPAGCWPSTVKASERMAVQQRLVIHLAGSPGRAGLYPRIEIRSELEGRAVSECW